MEEKDAKEEKPNKLSGCNNVLPPDKLLANSTALTLPAHSLGSGSFHQRAILAVVPPLLENNNLAR